MPDEPDPERGMSAEERLAQAEDEVERLKRKFADKWQRRRRAAHKRMIAQREERKAVYHEVELLRAMRRRAEEIERLRRLGGTLSQECAAMQEILRRVEWAAGHRLAPVCPVCEGARQRGHAADCALARAIG